MPQASWGNGAWEDGNGVQGDQDRSQTHVVATWLYPTANVGANRTVVVAARYETPEKMMRYHSALPARLPTSSKWTRLGSREIEAKLPISFKKTTATWRILHDIFLNVTWTSPTTCRAGGCSSCATARLFSSRTTPLKAKAASRSPAHSQCFE